MKNIEAASATAGAFVLAALLVVSGSAMAEGPAFGPDGNGPGKGMGMGHDEEGPHMLIKALKILADEIELSDDQRARIKKIVEDGRADVQPLKEQVVQLRQEMHALLKAKKLDKKKIKAKHAEVQAVKAQIADKKMDMVLEALDVLSAAQREELFTILDECKDKKGTGECKAMFKKMKDKQGKKGKGKGKSF